MVQEPIFHRNANPHHLVSSFITALEWLATQRKTQTKMKNIEIETEIKIKLCKLLQQLNQSFERAETMMDFVDDWIVDPEEQDLSI